MIFIDKNRAYWFRRFKDVSRQKIAKLFGPPSMISRGAVLGWGRRGYRPTNGYTVPNF